MPNQENAKPATEKPEEKSINVSDSLPGPEYANLVAVSHNQEEFLLRFISSSTDSGKVVAKIIVTPGHMKRFLAALQENLALYERNFGENESHAQK